MRAAITLAAIIILACQVSLSSDDTLDGIVTGMLSAREIVARDSMVPSYLEGLGVEQPDAELTPMQRYLLARHLLDCHHLMQALYHQGYRIDPNAPIMKLAARRFDGFEAYCLVEGGYYTARSGARL